MNLYGKNYTREQIRQRVGHISQIAGIKPYTLSEGRSRGVDSIDVKTGSGFNFTVLPGRAMDIAWMEYKGMPAGYISKGSIVHSQYYHPYGCEWLRSFNAGILTTCGLTHVGPPEKEGIWDLGQHGRISNTPAFQVSYGEEWEGDDLILTVQGKVQEASLFHENLVLNRKLVTRGGESRVTIYDEIENQGYQETPLMILYHMNVGFPVVSEVSRLVAPLLKSEARDSQALKGFEGLDCFESPTVGYEEQVFFHTVAADSEGNTCVAIINEEISFGFYVRYNKNQLPFFTQWKMMGQQDYVVGLEPGNCLPIGRGAAREKGWLQMIKPGEKKNIRLELGVLTSSHEISKFRENVRKLLEAA